MQVLVLGCGLQGRAVVHDLARSPAVSRVVCADANIETARAVVERFGSAKTAARAVDAADAPALAELLGGGFDVAIDLLPRRFARVVVETAMSAGVDLVNTNFDDEIRDLDDAARDAGVAVLPEMGFDPGIDLVMAAEAVRRLGRVSELASYGGGLPEPGADDNPLRYRVSWTWEGVLDASATASRVVREGRVVEVPAEEIFDADKVHTIEIAPFGTLEAFPNGDAAVYAERLGIAESAREVGRYTLRWPGHCQLWRSFAKLGFLSAEPVPGLRGISPRRFLAEHLGPQLGYGPSQRDLAILRVEARNEDGETVVFELTDTRDLDTDLMAMSRTVGFTASIAAQMLASGTIEGRGLLSPIRVPWAPFVAELAQRGIRVKEGVAPAFAAP